MIKVFLILVCVVTSVWAEPVFGQDDKIVNGTFKQGLDGWRATGDVHLQTNILDGQVCADIGPGAGSLAQRVEAGGGNPLTLTAVVRSAPTNGWILMLRFLDKDGREVMRVDSGKDIKIKGTNPETIKHYMQPHPLTQWIELVISKNSSGGTVGVDRVSMDIPDENSIRLKPACDLDRLMEPFWLGNEVYDEAVLLLWQDGKPAAGRLLFHPSRIISVQDYGLTTNYINGADYSVRGRTLICASSSRMPRVRENDLQKGEFKWNVVGGRQVMVTYDHQDRWKEGLPKYVGQGLPRTMKKLNAHEPLTVVAYGDSITHGYGQSRLSHIRPFLPPWPELFVHRLKEIYHDSRIQF